MEKLTYFPLVLDRWIAGTRHMTFEEKGMYLDLLIYLYEKPDRYLKDEAHMARILGCRPQKVRRIWPHISEKFRRFSGGFTHSLVRELQRNGMKFRGLQRAISPTKPDPEEEDKNPPIVPPLSQPTKPKPKRKPKRAAFRPPDISEVRAYCEERGKGVNPEAWMNHYQANGWKCGRNPMKDWRAAVRTWEMNKPQAQNPRRGNGAGGHQSWKAMVEALGREMGVPAKPGEDHGPYYARLQDIQRRAH